MSRGVLLVSLGTIAAVCIIAIGFIATTKVLRTARRRRGEELLRPFRSQLIAVSAGEDEQGHGARALVASDGAARELVDLAAVDMLGKIRGLPADQLVEILHAHGTVRQAIRDLGHRSSVRRAQAAQLLGLSRTREAVTVLVPALGDDAVEVRASAAYALGLIGDPAAAAPLLAAVDAPGAGLPAGIAAQALLSMGVEISDALCGALSSDRPGARHVAAYVCGSGAFTRAVPSLRRLLDQDDDLTVREASASALASMGTALDVEVLARHTSPDHPLSLRRICALALGQLGDPSAIPTLAGLLRDPDPRLVELSASALLSLGSAGRASLEAHAPEAGPDQRRRPIEAALTMARLQGVLP
jgi:HEAT repeat protein